MPNKSSHRMWLLFDMAFFIAITLFAFLATYGSIELSSAGVIMDSDLETYAQGMAGKEIRASFLKDPVLSTPTPANSIPNLQRWLAQWLTFDHQWAKGLLLSGGIAIFLFLAGWYLLGRWLFGFPILAAILALCSSITIWIGWGTFWGILHSNPVPRVFFAAIFPFLLLGFFYSLKNPFLRPAIMLAVGLCIWVHGVSSLNCGAMFFTAYLFIKPKNISLLKHFIYLFIALLAFFIPVLIFLWPSLTQTKPFTQTELEMFQNMFNVRWQEDYSNFGKRLMHFFGPSSPALPIMLGGIAGWIILFKKKSKKFSCLVNACPYFLCGLLLVTLICWCEGILAPKIGRLQMGHELVRGLRFLIPISWILIIAAVSLITSKITQITILGVVLALILFISKDQQYIAAQYALNQLTNIPLPLADSGKLQAAHAKNMREVFEAVTNIVPEGESVYCPQDTMPIRYISKRALSHSFKDGYVFFYNKDPKLAQKWLQLETLTRKSPQGWQDAWLDSGSSWLLLPPEYNPKDIRSGQIISTVNGWTIIHK